MRGSETNHPAGHRCPAEGDPEAAKLPLLAIQRHMIDELRRRDLRKQRRCRDTLRKQHRRYRRDLYALSATGAGILRPDVADDSDLRGLIIELLADLLANPFQCRAVGGAALLGVGNIVDDVHPGQAGIKSLATVL